mgnify:CR=1 FL=1
MLRFIQKNWFLICLLALLVIATLLPDVGTRAALGGLSSRVAVILIFLFTGFTLPSEAILRKLRDVRLHLYLQLFIFALVPLVVAATAPLFFADLLDGAVLTGLFALSVLPTTISSCVVFTSTSRGNTVAALFNAALANMLGVVISPLLLSLLLSGGSNAMGMDQIASTLMSLGLNILLPIIAGQIIRRRALHLAQTRAKVFGKINNVLILFIVFVTISRTAGSEQFVQSIPMMVWPFLYLAVLHIVLLVLAFTGGMALKLDKPDLVAVLFVAPQKTLAMGAPLLTIYFASDPQILGIALLPLLFYHPWQLVVAGFVKSLPWISGDPNRPNTPNE